MKDVEDSNIGRVFRLLEYFEQVRRPVGVGEAAELLGFPRSSAAAMFAALVKLGYLRHDRASRSYVPSLRVAGLGRWVEHSLFGEERALLLALLAQLRDRLEETVVLGALDDLNATYIHVELPQRPIVFLIKPGVSRPLTRSGVGWALLAQMPDAAVRRIAERNNALPANRDAAVPVEEFAATIAAVRARGYAYSRGTLLPGLGMIATALPAALTERPLAVGVGGPVQRLDAKEAEVVAVLRSAVADMLAAGGGVRGGRYGASPPPDLAEPAHVEGPPWA